MFTNVKGLVLRQVRYKEADRILTLLTGPEGKLTVKARGALRRGSKMAAASQALCYSEFTLFGNRGRWTANEGGTVEQFLGLREDIGQLALGTYFAEVLDTVCPEEQSAEPALQLALTASAAMLHFIRVFSRRKVLKYVFMSMDILLSYAQIGRSIAA